MLEENKKQRFVWVNIFFRDLLLVVILTLIQMLTHFNSKTVFFISGMMVVLVTWHIHDFWRWKKWHFRTS